ncbi:MAG: GlxA family transcriptional regulator [Reyranella sp.]
MRILILAPPGVQSLDVVGPAEVFWEAARRLGDEDAYRIEIVGTDAGPIPGTGSLRFLPDRTIYEPEVEADTLLVGGDPRLPPDVDPRVTDWIARMAPRVRRYGSICTGAFFLAAAGLLDGRQVTTHWECAAELAARYPKVRVESDHIFVRDGALCTAAGVSAGMDLALALVEEDYGRELALAVARYMVLFLKRPGGQSQFSTHLAAQLTGESSIQKVQQWVLSNLDQEASIETLAKHARMSNRNFTRTFHREAGMTPAEFVHRARLDAARRHLEDSSAPLKTIARDTGFGSAERMRRAFLKSMGVGPADYRGRFGRR